MKEKMGTGLGRCGSRLHLLGMERRREGEHEEMLLSKGICFGTFN